MSQSIIYVDDREVERDHPTRDDKRSGVNMLELIQKHRDSPPAKHSHLTAGDFCFAGEGPKGPCLIGVERKRIKDMLSSIRNGRFAGEQLPKLFNHYDYTFLVLEGAFRTNKYSGMIEDRFGRDYAPLTIGNSGFLGLELESFLTSVLATTPIRYIRTQNEHETVEWLVSLRHAFSKSWDHQLAKVTAIHQPEQYATVGKASTLRRFAYTLDKVGWEKSGVIEQNFRSVWEMVSTNPNCPCIRPPVDFQKLPGFGKTISQRVWDQIHGNHDPDVLE